MENLPKNVLFKISLEYNLHDLLNFCRISKKINNSICSNQIFWMKKLNKDYNIYSRDIQKKTKTYKLEKGFDYKNYYRFIVNNLNKYKDDFDELLINSSKKGYLNLVKIALNKGANIHAKEDYALRLASYYGHLDTVKFLLKSGANIHEREDYALRRASKNGHLATVKYLVKSGANIHADDDYALRMSSNYGHLTTVKFLVDSGANIHAKEDQAFLWASQNGYLEIVKFLKSQK